MYYHIISLGCPKNLVDSEVFHHIFQQAGYTNMENPMKANIIFINTCGFIQEAQEEAVNTILEICHLKNKQIIVTGCLVKRFKKDLIKKIPEVNFWLDLKDFQGLKKIITPKTQKRAKYKATFPRCLLTPHHYAYLRLSDGCNNHCTYCAIPSIRGPHCSVAIPDLINEAQWLSSLGVQELIITAQDTTLYGSDIYGKPMLSELLNTIESLNLFPWIRLLYLHPTHLNEKLIDELSQLKSLLPYFDIPLQHISTDILNLMNRQIDKETTIQKLNYLRRQFPQAAIRTTFMTGFPGEKKQHFTELKTFIQDFNFTRLGVFCYSPEKGTPAYYLPNKVAKTIAQKRKDQLMALQQQISPQILASFVGTKMEVIIDRKSDHPDYQYEGRSYLDAPDIDGIVYLENGNFRVGEIVEAEITEAWEYDFVAKVTNKS